MEAEPGDRGEEFVDRCIPLDHQVHAQPVEQLASPDFFVDAEDPPSMVVQVTDQSLVEERGGVIDHQHVEGVVDHGVPVEEHPANACSTVVHNLLVQPAWPVTGRRGDRDYRLEQCDHSFRPAFHNGG